MSDENYTSIWLELLGPFESLGTRSTSRHMFSAALLSEYAPESSSSDSFPAILSGEHVVVHSKHIRVRPVPYTTEEDSVQGTGQCRGQPP